MAELHPSAVNYTFIASNEASPEYSANYLQTT